MSKSFTIEFDGRDFYLRAIDGTMMAKPFKLDSSLDNHLFAVKRVADELAPSVQAAKMAEAKPADAPKPPAPAPARKATPR